MLMICDVGLILLVGRLVDPTDVMSEHHTLLFFLCSLFSHREDDSRIISWQENRRLQQFH